MKIPHFSSSMKPLPRRRTGPRVERLNFTFGDGMLKPLYAVAFPYLLLALDFGSLHSQAVKAEA